MEVFKTIFWSVILVTLVYINLVTLTDQIIVGKL